jgi:putative pyruvate formate lyase activating enzyme
MPFTASYHYLSGSQWDERIAAAYETARECRLCPRQCCVDRVAGKRGFCGAGNTLRISGIFAHHGEEPCISGHGGSGTIFFSHCTLKCVFCQNYQISHEGEGRPYSTQQLARHMLRLQQGGCHNINLVTPTHFLPWLLEAIRQAAADGLRIPIVYNCGGYELCETLDMLDGIVDIYLPDMKYGDAGPAGRYSDAKDYAGINRAAIRAMFRQAGALKTDSDGIAKRGLVIRHLVLPEGLAGSQGVCSFLKEAFDPEDIAVSIMAQYRPLYRAREYEELSRPVDFSEYAAACKTFIEAGFKGYYQDMERLNSSFVIDFKRRKNKALLGE